MRDRFPEFYEPQPDDERRFIVTGTVVVDANVLLGLYQFDSPQREEVLDVLESLTDRLWIPYQVGLEYQRNRMRVIRSQASNYTRLVELHGVGTEDDLVKKLSEITVPDAVAEEVRGLLGNLSASLDSATTEFVAAVQSIRDRHVVTPEQGLTGDPVRARLDLLFAGRVGSPPTDEDRKKRIAEATKRRGERRPPGYKDENKDSDDRQAGDYLLWAELLERAESTKGDDIPYLLVTNDTKEDWYERSGGRPVGPRHELVAEFLSHNPAGYHQVTLDGLLRLARTHLAADVTDSTIEKASELSESRGIDFAWGDRARLRGLADILALDSETTRLWQDQIKGLNPVWRLDPSVAASIYSQLDTSMGGGSFLTGSEKHRAMMSWLLEQRLKQNEAIHSGDAPEPPASDEGPEAENPSDPEKHS